MTVDYNSERIFSALDIRPAGVGFLENAGWNYFVYLLKHYTDPLLVSTGTRKTKNGERRKRTEGPRAEPEGGAEGCAGGNPRPRWRAADTEVGVRSGGGAVGKTDNHTGAISVQMLKTGGKARADAGGARVEGATFSTPGGGPQHTPRPAPGAAARQPADEDPTSTTVQDGGPTPNTSSKPHKRQNTRESGDSAQQNRMTLDTAWCILTRLRYSKENGATDKILSGIQNRRNEEQRPEAKDNRAPGAGGTSVSPTRRSQPRENAHQTSQ